MEPTIKGWCWNIPFYPCGMNGERTIKSIFWYDSSNDLEFTKHTGEYQIVIPETEIMSGPVEIDYVHKNIKKIFEEQMQIIRPVNGKWVLSVPWHALSKSFLTLGG
jgi:hypothetical protein